MDSRTMDAIRHLVLLNAIHNGPASLHAAVVGNDEGALHDAVMGHVKDLHSKIAASASGANQPVEDNAQNSSTAKRAVALFNSDTKDGAVDGNQDSKQAPSAASKADKVLDRKRKAGEFFKK